MTSYEWKVLIAILLIFVIGGVVRECRKSSLNATTPDSSQTQPLP